jgi:hypothetical protein
MAIDQVSQVRLSSGVTWDSKSPKSAQKKPSTPRKKDETGNIEILIRSSKVDMEPTENGIYRYDTKALLPWDPEALIRKGECSGACKNEDWRGIMRLAALDRIERGADWRQWLEWLDFRDVHNGNRKIADGGLLRGIVYCPHLATPIISKWLIVVCCPPVAQLLM